MPINAIISQPAVAGLAAAYRPIIFQVEAPILPNLRYFSVAVGVDGKAVIIAEDPTVLNGATNITFGNAAAINGTYAVASISHVDNTITVDVSPTLLTEGSYSLVTINLDGVPVLNPGAKYAPVVYCDIYFDGVYYKTQSKTQPINNPDLTGNDPIFQFDIQDACQEYLLKTIPANGQSVIAAVPRAMATVYCKFRISNLEPDGFTSIEGPEPQQGTGKKSPVAGAGTQSNSFYVVNATLQHEDNQDLATHLNSFKNGTWSANAFPLSHRPNGYRVCNGDSDVFPIIWTGPSNLKCLTIKFKKKGDPALYTASTCNSCIQVFAGTISFPDAVDSVAYSYSIPLTGSAPFTLANIVKPSWMSLNIVGTDVVATGTPALVDVNPAVTISFDILNCANIPVSVSDQIAVTTTAGCVAVAISGTPVLPDGFVGIPYSYIINLTGTGPFSLTSVVKPSWMTATVVGGTIVLGGTPVAAATGITVSFTINNACGTTPFSDTINTIGTAIISFAGNVFAGCPGATVEGSVVVDGTAHSRSSTPLILPTGDYIVKARARFIQATPTASSCLGTTTEVYLTNTAGTLLSDVTSDGTPAIADGADYTLHVDAGDTVTLYINTQSE